MAKRESKTQVDRLGDRLKGGDTSEADLLLLDHYRRSFGEAYEFVISTIRDRLGLQPTGRAAKSTTAIVDKLRRESIRLSQIQDMAGCRLIVSNLSEQDGVVGQLHSVFADARVIDRRREPSHGYRAVHVVVERNGKPVEIQVRTWLQHGWAELSEKLSDRNDKDIKYGGGAELPRSMLRSMSEIIARNEEIERAFSVPNGSAEPEGSSQVLAKVAEARAQMHRDLAKLIGTLSAAIGDDNAISD